MSLREYKRKRDFRRTPEPSGERFARATGLAFVVQKHAASRLHFDFRLEVDGVLKSWAIPKGPCLDPSVKTLAVQVEDHPLDYASFEGLIPEEEYGGGTVMVWDQGTWLPEGDPKKALRDGHLKFTLQGERLKGSWVLVRMKGHGSDDRKSWLLIKHKDDESKSRRSFDVVQEYQASVVSDRTLEEIANDADHVWKSNGKGTSAASRQARKKNDVMTNSVAGVSLTHPDRVLFPGEKLTKQDLAEYYAAIADWILPFVVERPLTLVRCPKGQGEKCFYQKHWTESLPSSVDRVRIKEKKGSGEYVLIHDLTGLISLVQMNVLELHPWGSRVDRFERPDQMVFDLDPGPEVSWEGVCLAARQIRERLCEAGLQSFVRTTGGKGLHVVVPMERRQSWDDVAEFSHDFAIGFAQQAPEQYVANMRKERRKGRIFIDYLRNQRGATAVASYSTRARAGAPVATPLAWDELDQVGSANRWTVANVPKRLSSMKEDPWHEFHSSRQRLTRQAQEYARSLVQSTK